MWVRGWIGILIEFALVGLKEGGGGSGAKAQQELNHCINCLLEVSEFDGWDMLV